MKSERRRQLKHDALTDALLTAGVWVRKQQKPITTGAIALLVIILVATGLARHASARAARAAVDRWKAERDELGTAECRRLAERDEGTPGGAGILRLLGERLCEEGSYVEAAEVFGDLAKVEGATLRGTAAEMRRAYALEEADQYAEAASIFGRVARDAAPYLRYEALMSQARTMALDGRTDDARALYQTLTDELESAAAAAVLEGAGATAASMNMQRKADMAREEVARLDRGRVTNEDAPLDDSSENGQDTAPETEPVKKPAAEEKGESDG